MILNENYLQTKKKNKAFYQNGKFCPPKQGFESRVGPKTVI